MNYEASALHIKGLQSGNYKLKRPPLSIWTALALHEESQLPRIFE